MQNKTSVFKDPIDGLEWESREEYLEAIEAPEISEYPVDENREPYSIGVVSASESLFTHGTHENLIMYLQNPDDPTICMCYVQDEDTLEMYPEGDDYEPPENIRQKLLSIGVNKVLWFTPDKELSSIKLASILDPVQPVRAPDVWDGDKLKPEVREHLISLAFKLVSSFVDEEEVPLYLQSLMIIGSITGLQYSDLADIDAKVKVDIDGLSERLGIDQDLMIHELREVLIHDINDDLLPGTTYPVTLLLHRFDELPIADGIYEVIHDEWIKKPEDPKDFDPYLNLKDSIDEAERIAEKVDAKWGAAMRAYENLRKYPQNRMQIERQIVRILRHLSRILKNVIGERQEVFENAQKEGLDPPQASTPNVIYKYLFYNGIMDKLHGVSSTLAEYEENGTLGELKMVHHGSYTEMPSEAVILPSNGQESENGSHIPITTSETLRTDSKVSQEKISNVLNFEPLSNTGKGIITPDNKVYWWRGGWGDYHHLNVIMVIESRNSGVDINELDSLNFDTAFNMGYMTVVAQPEFVDIAGRDNEDMDAEERFVAFLGCALNRGIEWDYVSFSGDDGEIELETEENSGTFEVMYSISPYVAENGPYMTEYENTKKISYEIISPVDDLTDEPQGPRYDKFVVFGNNFYFWNYETFDLGSSPDDPDILPAHYEVANMIIDDDGRHTEEEYEASGLVKEEEKVVEVFIDYDPTDEIHNLYQNKFPNYEIKYNPDYGKFMIVYSRMNKIADLDYDEDFEEFWDEDIPLNTSFLIAEDGDYGFGEYHDEISLEMGIENELPWEDAGRVVDRLPSAIRGVVIDNDVFLISQTDMSEAQRQTSFNIIKDFAKEYKIDSVDIECGSTRFDGSISEAIGFLSQNSRVAAKELRIIEEDGMELSEEALDNGDFEYKDLPNGFFMDRPMPGRVNKFVSIGDEVIWWPEEFMYDVHHYMVLRALGFDDDPPVGYCYLGYINDDPEDNDPDMGFGTWASDDLSNPSDTSMPEVVKNSMKKSDLFINKSVV